MTSPWADYSAGFELRSYQKAALNRFESVRAAGKRQFYLVAPPGSGKTLLGLSMAASLGEPAVVLSPTTTIAEQWLGRLREHWVCLDSALERFEPNPVATSEPSADRFALGSLTYQRLSVPGTEQELHENVRRLHATLEAAGVGTLILDECHHLSRAWGVAVKELIRALGAPFVIGLTATPIHVAAGPLVELTRAPDHAISLPSVVRNGDLAPYQELCHTVAPSTEEQSLIDASLGSFEALFEECCRASPDRFSLLHWLEELVSDPSVDAAHRSDRLLELSDSERDLVVALCRLRNERGGEPPEVLPYAPEFDDPTELGDRLLLVAHYTAQVLLREPALASGELAVRARAILSDWGYLVVEQRVSEKLGDVSEIVGFSRQKLEGAAAILRTELRHTGEELRVLIVTDFEFPPEGSRALSCLEVMDL